MISLILIFIAAAFNAVMDRVENENFFESVFKNRNQRFWYKRVSWQYARKVFGYKIDAWHLAKSAMVICLLSAIVGATFGLWPVFVLVALIKSKWLLIAANFIIFGTVWNLSFGLFYNKILKRK